MSSLAKSTFLKFISISFNWDTSYLRIGFDVEGWEVGSKSNGENICDTGSYPSSKGCFPHGFPLSISFYSHRRECSDDL